MFLLLLLAMLWGDVRESDRGVYYFRVERGKKVRFNYISYKLHLEVTARTQKPDVHIEKALWPGRLVTIICVFNITFEECPAPTFSWDGAAVTKSVTRTSTRTSSRLLLTPRPQDFSTDLTCRVHFGTRGVSVERTVRLDKAYSPKDAVISVSLAKGAAPQPQQSGTLLAQKGQYLQLLCDADILPRPTLTWTLQDRVLSHSGPQSPKAQALVLPAVKEGDAGTYTCRAENPLGSRNRTLHLAVQYPPENLRVVVSLENRTVLETSSSTTTVPVLQGQSLQLLCVAPSNPPASLSWSQGTLVLSSTQLPPGLLLLPRIQPHQEGNFICRAWNQLGSQNMTVSIRVHSVPQLLGPSCSWEAPGLRCSCWAHAWPAPVLRWWLDQELLQENHSNASFQVNSSSKERWANSSLSLLEESGTGLTVRCEARNDYGAQRASVLLLPDEQRSFSKGFSNGALLGAGVSALLCLCVILILVKMLKKKKKKKGAQAERLSRRSTILDYVNVFPRGGAVPPAQNQETKQSGPQAPPPMPSPQARTNQKQKQQCLVGPGNRAEPSAPMQAPQANQDEVLYSTILFHERRPRRELQESSDSQKEYVEIKFH